MRTVIIALAAAIGMLSAAPAAAQKRVKSEAIDCQESQVFFPDFPCYTAVNAAGSAAPVRIFGTSGSGENGFRFLVQLQMVNNGGYYESYDAKLSAEIIRAVAAAAVMAPIENWGHYQGFGSTGFMTFTSNGQHCIGFDHAAGGNRPDSFSMGSGYAQLLQGYFCESHPMPNPEERLRHFLAAVRVGPSASGRNALGSPVVPSLWLGRRAYNSVDGEASFVASLPMHQHRMFEGSA